MPGDINDVELNDRLGLGQFTSVGVTQNPNQLKGCM